MDKNNVIEFLLEKPGYLKVGPTRLAERLEISEDIAELALHEARKLMREEEDVDTNLILKSRWQTASGEWRESYRVAKDDSIDELKQLKRELFNDLKSISPYFVATNKVILKDPVALEISLPDFHFGKIDGSSLEQQSQLYIDTIVELTERASGYNVEKYILPIGNDLFNSEGYIGTTTKGTPQKDNADWKVIYRTVWMTLVKAINFLSQKAPVDVISVPGNHDFAVSFNLAETLVAYFYKNQNVTVNNNGETRKYYQYGKNLLGYTHGDKEKPHELPLIMATEVPILFANSIYRSWRLGHLHKRMLDSYRGVEVEVLPALCGADEWHKQMGYGANRQAMATIWNKERGKEGTLQINK